MMSQSKYSIGDNELKTDIMEPSHIVFRAPDIKCKFFATKLKNCRLKFITF